MYNRLKVVRAGILGIVWVGVCFALVALLGYMHIVTDSGGAGVGLLVLGVLTLGASWATVRPYVIYGGLHAFAWCVVVGIGLGIASGYPLLIGLIISLLLFLLLDPIMRLLHSLDKTVYVHGMPVQPRQEMFVTPDPANYQQGYQPASGPSYREGEKEFPYPQGSYETVQMPPMEQGH